MAKLRCPKCGNNDVWKSLTMNGKAYKAICGKCDEVVKGTGGVQVGRILGNMDFNF